VGFNGNVVDSEVVSIATVNPESDVGDTADNLPGYELSFFVNSNFQWSESVTGHFQVNYSAQDEMLFHFRSSGLVEVIDRSDKVGFLGAHLGADWGSWSAEIFGSNLTDESGYVTPYTSFGAGVQARPRTIGLRVGVEF
jgi:hypothetical protein